MCNETWANRYDDTIRELRTLQCIIPHPMTVSAPTYTHGRVHHAHFDTANSVGVCVVASRDGSRPHIEAATRVCGPSVQHRLQTRRLNYATARLQRHGSRGACDVDGACRVDRWCLSSLAVVCGHITNGTRCSIGFRDRGCVLPFFILMHSPTRPHHHHHHHHHTVNCA